MIIQEGTRLGPYEVVAPIGAGGMGEVWRGKDTRLGRDVAIKILPAQLAQSAQFKIRFEREARTISSLNHPNICTLFTLAGDTSVGARFTWTPASYTLTVARSGAGHGVVKSRPEGIDCGEKCTGAFARGSSVELTAIPESTSTFMGWSGGCSGTSACIVSMTRPVNVTATFGPPRERTIKR